ncbi:hypothetical protein IE81DRAFT_322870 [Ceraceosorus guamensis]|uniref:Clathrin light chain n=1 Tax=Ceraceosorus guamensis TaxID=1522189 RepID=A0A316VZ53_9BASI|nr:hypothetical protein IE81DRAFT_322870 [Ceraceosorus guamensis]PWN42947.1 hypothetical protein IE81DRAFT_322870 [Ceraceosorus guamensis]
MSFDFNTSAPESDPTADFLARERAAAGALQGDADLFGSSVAGGAAGVGGEKDFESGAAAFPSLDGDEPSATATTTTNNNAGGFGDEDDLLGGGASAFAQQTRAPVDEMDKFQSEFPELEEEMAMPASQPPISNTNGYSSATAQPGQSFGAGGGSSGYAGVSDPYSHLNNAEESEAVKQWRTRQADDIAKRDAEAERKKSETISKAEQDIDKFYEEYNAKKEKSIKQNKESEAAFLAQQSAELAEGTTWSRVTKLLDLQNSQSKTIARGGPGSTDLTRMKEILLSLRREGQTAPGAAGY